VGEAGVEIGLVVCAALATERWLLGRVVDRELSRRRAVVAELDRRLLDGEHEAGVGRAGGGEATGGAAAGWRPRPGRPGTNRQDAGDAAAAGCGPRRADHRLCCRHRLGATRRPPDAARVEGLARLDVGRGGGGRGRR